MECWNCRAVNPPGSKFCYRCGKAMERDQDRTPAATEQWRPEEPQERPAWQPPPEEPARPRGEPIWAPPAEPVQAREQPTVAAPGTAWPPRAQAGEGPTRAPAGVPAQEPASAPARELARRPTAVVEEPTRRPRRRGVPGIVWFLLGVLLVVALGTTAWFFDWLQVGPEGAPPAETPFVEATPEEPIVVTVVVTPIPPAVEAPVEAPPAEQPAPAAEAPPAEQPAPQAEVPPAEQPAAVELFDGRIGISVAGVEATRELPPEYGLPAPSGGGIYAKVTLIVTRIEGVHVTNLLGHGEENSRLYDNQGQSYDLVYGTFRGVTYSDPTDIRSPSELVVGAEGVLVYEIPEDRLPVALNLVYSYRLSWDDADPKTRGEMAVVLQ